MSIHLTPEQERLIRAKLRAGKYDSAEAALDIALRLLDDYERAEDQWLGSMCRRVESAIAVTEDTPSLDGETLIYQILEEKFQAGTLRQTENLYRIHVWVGRTLEEIADNFAFTDIYGGERFFLDFNETCRQLVYSPGQGDRYDQIRLGLRGFRLSGHVVFYRIAEMGLEVISMASSHRLLASPLDESGFNSLEQG
ncbi:MAG: hypothetical protein ACFE0I_07245 [Elainellaceae cyanobacterium]